MNLEELEAWAAMLGLGSMTGTVLALIVKAVIDRKNERYLLRLEEERKRGERIQETDRVTYGQPGTVLVHEHLAGFIVSGEWSGSGDDLERLLTRLSQGTYERFLDPVVNREWERLIHKSMELATRRLANELDSRDIRAFNLLRSRWQDACKRSFGPLPATRTRMPLDLDRTGS